jgi:hypothetical protein
MKLSTKGLNNGQSSRMYIEGISPNMDLCSDSVRLSHSNQLRMESLSFQWIMKIQTTTIFIFKIKMTVIMTLEE